MPVVDTPQSTCRFGIARCDITPPVGIYHRMWGAASHDRSTGVHRPLLATAMIFAPLTALGESAKRVARITLISIDHCLLWAKEMDTLRARISRATGRPFSEIQITFSHTHSAGLMGLERRNLPGGDLIEPYLESLAEKLSALVVEAESSLAPADVVYGTGRCNLATHRDLWDPAVGRFVCGFNPDGPADDTLLVARVTSSSDGATRAIFVNYACHPTSLAWENTLISSDFPGALRELVEAHYPPLCVFLQGASGDLGPRECYSGDPAIADRNGRQLGYAVLSVLEALPTPRTQFEYTGAVISGATLGTWRYVAEENQRRKAIEAWRAELWNLDLPLRADRPQKHEVEAELQQWTRAEQVALQSGDVRAAADARAQSERATRMLGKLATLPNSTTFPLPISLWKMGDAFWLTLEAEYYQVLQTTLRRRHLQVPIVIITLTNGWRVSYLPPAEVYGLGIYQEEVAMLAPGTLETTIDAIDHAIRNWRDESQ